VVVYEESRKPGEIKNRILGFYEEPGKPGVPQAVEAGLRG
jgi:hypothetical protein